MASHATYILRKIWDFQTVQQCKLCNEVQKNFFVYFVSEAPKFRNFFICFLTFLEEACQIFRFQWFKPYFFTDTIVYFSFLICYGFVTDFIPIFRFFSVLTIFLSRIDGLLPKLYMIIFFSGTSFGFLIFHGFLNLKSKLILLMKSLLKTDKSFD